MKGDSFLKAQRGSKTIGELFVPQHLGGIKLKMVKLSYSCLCDP
jgi:hypothetical protein